MSTDRLIFSGITVLVILILIMTVAVFISGGNTSLDGPAETQARIITTCAEQPHKTICQVWELWHNAGH